MSIKRFSSPLTAQHVAEAFSEPKGIANIVALFKALGTNAGEILTDPDPERVLCPDSRALLKWYCDQRPEKGQMPVWAEFSPEQVRPLLGSLHVISAPDDHDALFFEIFGTSVAARYGVDLTKKHLPLSGNSLAVVFHGIFKAAIRQERVIYTVHYPPEGSKIRDCQRLMLPFANEKGAFHRLVVAHRPVLPARGKVGGVI